MFLDYEKIYKLLWRAVCVHKREISTQSHAELVKVEES